MANVPRELAHTHASHHTLSGAHSRTLSHTPTKSALSLALSHIHQLRVHYLSPSLAHTLTLVCEVCRENCRHVRLEHCETFYTIKMRN